jgi:hypothetical protein
MRMDREQEESRRDEAPETELDDGRSPPPDDLSTDPAYEPPDEGMKEIKGG